MMKKFGEWWISRNHSTEEAYKDWVGKTKTNYNTRKPSKPYRKPNKPAQPKKDNLPVNQVSNATPVAEKVEKKDVYSPEIMQKAAEILTALNPSQPTVGVLPMQNAYGMTQFQSKVPNYGSMAYSNPHPWGPPPINYWGFGQPNFNPNQTNFNTGRPRPQFSGKFGTRENQNWEGQDELQYCSYCQRNVGHTKAFCRKRMRDEMLKQPSNRENEFSSKSPENRDNVSREFQRKVDFQRSPQINGPPKDFKNGNRFQGKGQSEQRHNSGKVSEPSKNGERRPHPQR
jgi:hypothetical protein